MAKILRQLLGLAAGCLAGVLLPVAGTVYDALYRHRHGGSPHSWPGAMYASIQFVVLGSVCVGLSVGSIGLLTLHVKKRSGLKSYALTGLGLGAATGALFTAMMHYPGDTPLAWPIFTLLSAFSMALGFMAYWCVCVRGRPYPPSFR